MPEIEAPTLRNRIVSLTGLSLAVILYISINLFFNVSAPVARLDLTDDGLYTLSAGTLATLTRVEEPVELHFFFSERLGREIPYYATYGRRVRELLAEVSAVSAGKVILHEYNPESFSSEEDRAVSFGVQGIPLDQGGELAYFGLAGSNRGGDVELIPFFQPEREALLEYDLMQIVHTLSNPEPSVLGVMSSLPIMGDVETQMQGGLSIPWVITDQLRKQFQIVNLPESIDSIPQNVNVLMVVHPRNMNDRALYALEQFLFRGGRAMLFVDPKFESDLSMSPDQTSTSASGLQKLFKQWGIEVPEGRLVGDRSMALRINAGTAAQPIPADYILWLRVPSEFMSEEDPVTRQLTELNIATTGFITRNDKSTVSMETLITSSKNSSQVSADEALGFRPDILGMQERFQPDDEQYTIAARLTGFVDSAFPEGPPARILVTDEPEKAQLMQPNGPVNLILVADADLLDERFWLRKQPFFGREVKQKIAGNADFVLNALGNLAGGDELLNLRSRGVSQRPFEKIKDLEREAESRFQHKERELQEKLTEIQEKIAQLETVPGIDNPNENKPILFLTDEQRSEMEMLRKQMLSIRKELRAVQRSLREDVEALESWLQFVNIGLMPLLVMGIAIALWVFRVLRRNRLQISDLSGAG